MATHEYTPKQALDLLMKKISDRDDTLAALIKEAIDAGKDVRQTAESTGRKPKKTRVYRKSMPYNDQEALQVALDSLRDYFVEQPLFVNSIAKHFKVSGIGKPNQPASAFIYDERAAPVEIQALDVEKAIEIEIRTETQLSLSGAETIPLKRFPELEIDEQSRQIALLRRLTDFTVEE
jgi:hypothetical protein